MTALSRGCVNLDLGGKRRPSPTEIATRNSCKEDDGRLFVMIDWTAFLQGSKITDACRAVATVGLQYLDLDQCELRGDGGAERVDLCDYRTNSSNTAIRCTAASKQLRMGSSHSLDCCALNKTLLLFYACHNHRL
jgi:hypothetical protein